MPSSSATVPVNVPGAGYDVTIRPALLADLGLIVRQLSRSAKLGIVTDTHVGPLYLPAVEQSCRQAGFEPIIATLPAGEQNKTLDSIARLYDTFLPARIDRQTPLLALGGGVIGDMTGFAAATILRGVPFIQAPTTLLAMVDASVGGKTAIDHACGKNLIGAFHQPMAVLIDPLVLKTLPPREIHGGLAECIKHDIIRDADGFAQLEQNIHRALTLDAYYLTDLLAHNIAVKAKVVAADPYEKGERAHLNFGHTFGHAIETLSLYSYSHGESVALGMVAASRLAVQLGMLDEPSLNRIIHLIQLANLPTGSLKLDPQAVIGAMAFDKKIAGRKIRLVLPDRIGHVVIRDDVSPEQLLLTVQSLQG